MCGLRQLGGWRVCRLDWLDGQLATQDHSGTAHVRLTLTRQTLHGRHCTVDPDWTARSRFVRLVQTVKRALQNQSTAARTVLRQSYMYIYGTCPVKTFDKRNSCALRFEHAFPFNTHCTSRVFPSPRPSLICVLTPKRTIRGGHSAHSALISFHAFACSWAYYVSTYKPVLQSRMEGRQLVARYRPGHSWQVRVFLLRFCSLSICFLPSTP